MKVGILTFHRANNFGAFLQAFALCKKLNEINDVCAEIVDYRCPTIEREYAPDHLLIGSGNRLKKRIVYILRKPTMRKNENKFNMARAKYLIMSKSSVEMDNINKIESEYDCFVSGSDQIWNERLTGSDNTYFLNFVQDNKKKNSYAASMGELTYSDKKLLELKTNLLEFAHISVREKSTADFIEKLTGRDDIRVSLDPVFLMSMSEWKSYIKCPDATDYILYYTVGSPQESTLNFAKKLAKKESKRILFIRDRDVPYKNLDLHHINGIDPMEFLGYIYNASCIVTNSFHATAFAILFHKEFYIETKTKRNERMLDLLALSEITNRTLFDGCLINENSNSINWALSDNKISTEVDASLHYLKGVIGV